VDTCLDDPNLISSELYKALVVQERPRQNCSTSSTSASAEVRCRTNTGVDAALVPLPITYLGMSVLCCNKSVHNVRKSFSLIVLFTDLCDV